MVTTSGGTGSNQYQQRPADKPQAVPVANAGLLQQMSGRPSSLGHRDGRPLAAAELFLDAAQGRLLVGNARSGLVELHRGSRHGTLCEAAVEACQTGQLVVPPEGLQRAGYVDPQNGQVRLLPAVAQAVSGVWGAPLDRRQLESVALERADDERRQFRRAVVTGNMGQMAKLGPRRGWRW